MQGRPRLIGRFGFGAMLTLTETVGEFAKTMS
jgi:hypothetical protein